MALRDRFRINGNHMELTGNVPSNIGRVPETSERFQTLSKRFGERIMPRELLINGFSI
jgi:hypothetical protein